MNNNELSIIIPCYNSEATLKEAVDSCFCQGISNFEIVLIDDASTDKTRKIMHELADEHKEIKIFYNEKNKGGGATRNTGIQQATSDVIFCLDSDDILPEGTLHKMLSFLKEKKADGVGIHRSIKFKGIDRNDIERIDTFGYVGEKIPFQSLIEKDNVLCPLYSTFMMTKNAFTVAGGYPTEHGFDTQGFAWRFLMHGLTAYTCPNAEYLHRTHFHESYYLREYNAGKINYNWQQVLEEFIVAFSPEVREMIINFDIRDPEHSLVNEIKKIGTPWSDSIHKIIGNEILKVTAQEKNSTLMRRKVRIPFKPVSRYSVRGILQRGTRRVSRYVHLIKDVVYSRRFRITLIFAYIVLQIKKYFKLQFSLRGDASRKVDIVVPTILKDHALLVQMVNSLRVNIEHQINKIYIISRNTAEIKLFCKENGCHFVEEETVLGYGREKINYNYKGLDRRGWMLQQLLKLSGDSVTECDDYIVVDSDTLLIAKHSFIIDNKYVFFENEEWNEPYFKSYQKIFGYRPKNRLSFTSHMMIFNRKELAGMKKEMEVLHKKSWDEVYLGVINEKEMSCISDYDTYANWVYHNHPGKVLRLPFYNKSMPRSQLAEISYLCKQYGRKYMSLSFHSYFERNFKEVIQESLQ